MSRCDLGADSYCPKANTFCCKDCNEKDTCSGVCEDDVDSCTYLIEEDRGGK